MAVQFGGHKMLCSYKVLCKETHLGHSSTKKMIHINKLIDREIV